MQSKLWLNLVLILLTANWLARAQSSNTAEDSYKLLPGDTLAFRIEEDPAKDNDQSLLPVTSLGMINFPVTRAATEVVPIKAAGKTVEQVRKELKVKLEADYYYQATIFLQLATQTQRYGQASFHGEVKGTIQLPPGVKTSVSEAVVKLGYTEFANLEKVKITRTDPSTKKTVQKTIDVHGILFKPGADRSKDEVLQDGDLIEVPPKKILF